MKMFESRETVCFFVQLCVQYNGLTAMRAFEYILNCDPCLYISNSSIIIKINKDQQYQYSQTMSALSGIIVYREHMELVLYY